MGQRSTRYGIGLALLDGLNDVKMIENIVQTAVVREAIKQRASCFFCLHSVSSSYRKYTAAQNDQLRAVWLTA